MYHKYRVGDRVRFKRSDGVEWTGGVKELSPFVPGIQTQPMYWISYSESAPGFYPNPLLHGENDLTPAEL